MPTMPNRLYVYCTKEAHRGLRGEWSIRVAMATDDTVKLPTRSKRESRIPAQRNMRHPLLPLTLWPIPLEWCALSQGRCCC